MNPFRMSLSRRSLFALPAVAAIPALAQTETFPTKAIRIVVPFAPGGSGDITARLVGKYIEDKTGQPFVVENKPGANGIVGAGALVTEGKEFPDGSLIIGSPAKLAKTLDDEAIARFSRGARHYVENARRYAQSLKCVEPKA